jgi:hypothetical protein
MWREVIKQINFKLVKELCYVLYHKYILTISEIKRYFIRSRLNILLKK